MNCATALRRPPAQIVEEKEEKKHCSRTQLSSSQAREHIVRCTPSGDLFWQLCNNPSPKL